MMKEPDLARLQRREFLWRVTALGLGVVALILGATLWATRHGWQPQKREATSILETPEDFRELQTYLQQAEIETLTDFRQTVDAWILMQAYGDWDPSEFAVIDHNR